MTSPPLAPTRPRSRVAPPLVDRWSVAIVLLGAIQPFAAFLSSNATNLVDPVPIVATGAVWAALVLLAFVAVRLLTRSSRPLPIAAGFVAFNLSFWNFGRWLSSEPGSTGRRWIALLLWAAVTALAVRLVSKLAEHPAARMFLTIFLSVWVLASIGGFALARPAIEGGDAAEAYAGPSFAPFTEHPNVYWIILDEHARSDQLARWTGSDNSWFDRDLEERGFSVSTSTQTGYVHTHLSIASTLSMTYSYLPGQDYRGEYALTTAITQGDNPVVRTFEDNGYRFVYAPDGSVEWSVCPPASETRSCIEPLGGPLAMREPYSRLVLASPVGSFELEATRNDLDSVLDGAEAIRDQTDQPLFVMAHILSPHQPYRYEPDCSLRGEPVVGTKLTGEERAAAYANDVQCLDHETVGAVDRIMSGDPDAVVIVQSDHGSRLSFNWDQPYAEWTPAMLTERFGALDAIRLPERCRETSIEGQPLVNTFRIVLACLSDQNPDLLDTRTFFNSYGEIYTLVEVPPERFDEP